MICIDETAVTSRFCCATVLKADGFRASADQPFCHRIEQRESGYGQSLGDGSTVPRRRDYERSAIGEELKD